MLKQLNCQILYQFPLVKENKMNFKNELSYKRKYKFF